MKKSTIYMGIGVLLSAVAIGDFTMDIDNKGHYFGNGILCGVGLSVIAAQLLKLKKTKPGNSKR